MAGSARISKPRSQEKHVTRGLSPLLQLEWQYALTHCGRIARKCWMVVGLFIQRPHAHGLGVGEDFVKRSVEAALQDWYVRFSGEVCLT